MPGPSAFIYTVNPFPVHVSVGQFGDMVIPGRAKDERFNRFEVKSRKYGVDMGSDKKIDQEASGLQLAKDIVSRNPGLGLFIASEHGPTKNELQTAVDALLVEDEKRVTHGDMLWDSSNHNRMAIANEARQACVRLGYTRAWADGEAQTAMKRCRGCAEVILSQAIICKHCGWNQTKDPLTPEPVAPAAEKPALPA